MRIELDGSMTLSVEEYKELYREKERVVAHKPSKAVVRVPEHDKKRFKRFTETETMVLKSMLDSGRYRTKGGKIKHKKMLSLSESMGRSVASISNKLSVLRGKR